MRICKLEIWQDIKSKEEFEDWWDNFCDKTFKWWDDVTLLIIVVTILLCVFFSIKENMDGLVYCAIVLGITIVLKAVNPFDRGGGSPFGWF